MNYIWQRKSWPGLTVNAETILKNLAKARQNQGRLLETGRFLDLKTRGERLVEEVLNTSAI